MSESRDAMIERAKVCIKNAKQYLGDWPYNDQIAKVMEDFALAEIAQAERKAVADAFGRLMQKLPLQPWPEVLKAMDEVLGGIGEDTTDAS